MARHKQWKERGVFRLTKSYTLHQFIDMASAMPIDCGLTRPTLYRYHVPVWMEMGIIKRYGSADAVFNGTPYNRADFYLMLEPHAKRMLRWLCVRQALILQGAMSPRHEAYGLHYEAWVDGEYAALERSLRIRWADHRVSQSENLFANRKWKKSQYLERAKANRERSLQQGAEAALAELEAARSLQKESSNG